MADEGWKKAPQTVTPKRCEHWPDQACPKCQEHARWLNAEAKKTAPQTDLAAANPAIGRHVDPAVIEADLTTLRTCCLCRGAGTIDPESNVVPIDLWLLVRENGEHEKQVRRDERRRIASALDKSVNAGELLALHRVLKGEPKARRVAGLLVHTLNQILDAVMAGDGVEREQAAPPPGRGSRSPSVRRSHEADGDLLTPA